jgi:hypothetical protein
VQRDAARDLAVGAREQQPARGRRVVAGQRRQLAVEALEAEIDADRLLVFEEQARTSATSSGETAWSSRSMAGD